MPPSRTLPPALAPPEDVAAAAPDQETRTSRPGSRAARARLGPGPAIGLGTAVIYLSLLVLIPLAAVVHSATENGTAGFWASVTAPDARSALVLTLGAAAVVTAINTVM